MTSSGSSGGGTSGSGPTPSTQLSTETPSQSSIVVDRERSRWVVRKIENETRQSLMVSLAIKQSDPGGFPEIREFERGNDCDWLAGLRVNDKYCYLPHTISDQNLHEKIKQLGQKYEHSEQEIRKRTALYQLFLLTVPRNTSQKDRTNMLNTFLGRLLPFTPEAVELVCLELAEDETFFPSWKAFHEKIAEYAGWREEFRKALINAAKRRQRRKEKA